MRLAAAFSRDPHYRRAARGGGASAVRWLELLAERDRLIAAVETFLRRFDAWLCPVAATVAFEHRTPHRPDVPLCVDGVSVSAVDAAMGHTAFFNLTGHPAVTLPVAQSEGGLPIGVQLVGRRWDDLDLLHVAAEVAAVTRGYRPPPDRG
jgi:amidase